MNKSELKNEDIGNKVDQKTERADSKTDCFAQYWISGIFLNGGYKIVMKEDTSDPKIPN